ncbi:MAG: HAD-IA family hydrolase [Bacteroidota bacterium]|jgi:phosphoglycolate phosphatase
MYKGVIFDFDYTLADSSKGVYQCINYALVRLGLSEVSYPEICKTIGLSLENTFVSLTHNREREIIEQFIELFTNHADKVMTNNTFIYENVPKTLNYLKGLGLKIGITSTKYRYRICEILTNNNLISLFDFIIGGEDVASHKPNPEGIYKIIEALKVDKSECVYVGDSIVDAETAKNADISYIAVLTGTTRKEDIIHYRPVLIINRIDELVSNDIWL